MTSDPKLLGHYKTPKNSDWQNSAAVTASRVRLQSASATDKSGVGFWLWVCKGPLANAATLAEAWPEDICWVPGNGSNSIDMRDYPEPFAQGFALYASSDPVTLTPVTDNRAFFRATYEHVP